MKTVRTRPTTKVGGTAKSTGSLLRWARGRKGALAFVAVFAVVAWAKPMGLLLWARIRILTSIPRTAIADDPATAPEAAPAPVELDTGLPGRTSRGSDPFWIDPSRYPTPNDATSAMPDPVPTPKSDGATADERRLEAIEKARRSAEGLRLQSAGKGLAFAVIDGRTHRVGDTFEGEGGMTFTLLEVREGSALLGCCGESFEIRLR